MAKMNILTITTLYPNALEPRHGIFVRNRLKAMDHFDGFSRKVIAPVPQCPYIHWISDRYKRYLKMPESEVIDNIEVHHPGYFTLPGMSFFDNANSMAKAANEILAKLYSAPQTPDLIDGQYLYPDGVAAYKVAEKIKKPLVLTARGSDVNYWMQNSKAKEKILEAINYSSKVICVSNALKQSLIEHGVEEEKICVIINGVDPDCFNPNIEKNPLREEYFLSVGNLVPLKGHHLTLNAFTELPRRRLIIVGDGEQKDTLKSQAASLGLSGRIQFIKHLDQKKLAEFYAGAKATILMSEMEGMPNVLLESLATGTPVIACDVGGVSEIVNPENGILLNTQDEFELIDAIEKMEDLNFFRSEVSETVTNFRWNDVAQRQYDVYRNALSSFR